MVDEWAESCFQMLMDVVEFEKEVKNGIQRFYKTIKHITMGYMYGPAWAVVILQYQVDPITSFEI